MFSLLALAIIAILLAGIAALAVLTGMVLARMRNLRWRVEDLEQAVRQLQAAAPPSRDVGGGSTAIRE